MSLNYCWEGNTAGIKRVDPRSALGRMVLLLLLPTRVRPALAALRREVARATEIDSSLLYKRKQEEGREAKRSVGGGRNGSEV